MNPSSKRRLSSSFATYAVALSVSACVVPQARYDVALEKERAAQAERRRAELDLTKARAEIARLGESLTAKEKSLEARDGELAQWKLDVERATTEREDAGLLVDQLRGELGRIGEHLRGYSDQKKELEAALEKAEARSRELDLAERQIEAKVLVVRDVAVALGESSASGKAAVLLESGKPAVRFEPRGLFGAADTELVPQGTAALERLGSVLARRAGLRVQVADRSLDTVTPEDRIVRLQKVADVLVAKGLTMDRIGITAPEESPEKAATPKGTGDFREGPGSIELVIAPEDAG